MSLKSSTLFDGSSSLAVASPDWEETPRVDDFLEPSNDTKRKLCPISRAICMLEKKWTIHIIYELSKDKRRFCHLQEAIGNANSRTLSDRLKELVEQGLIRREIIHTIPPWVEYSLTEKGTELCRIVDGIAEWAQKWTMFNEECWDPEAGSSTAEASSLKEGV